MGSAPEWPHQRPGKNGGRTRRAPPLRAELLTLHGWIQGKASVPSTVSLPIGTPPACNGEPQANAHTDSPGQTKWVTAQNRNSQTWKRDRREEEGWTEMRETKGAEENKQDAPYTYMSLPNNK